MIPSDVIDAVAAARQQGVPSESSATGEVNEIAVAAGPDSSVRRVVAVVSKDGSNQTVRIHLVASETEQATDLDLIIEPRDDGLPFPYIVQGELYGQLFSDQLLNAIGSLRPDEAEAIATALETDGESLEHYKIGPPLAGSDDTRRAFKDAELAELEELVAACQAWMMGAPAERAVPDPAMLLPPPTGSAQEVAEAMYLELLTVLADRAEPIVLPSELLTGLGHSQLFDDLSRWQTEFGLDVARVLAQIRIPDEIRGGALEPPLRERGAQEDRSLVVLREYLACEARAGTMAIDVRSTHTRWTREDRLILVKAAERFCRGRVVLEEAA